MSYLVIVYVVVAIRLSLELSLCHNMQVSLWFD